MGVHVLVFGGGDLRQQEEADLDPGPCFLEDKGMQEVLLEDVAEVKNQEGGRQIPAESIEQATFF